MAEIVELKSLTESQSLDIQALIKELVPGLSISLERLASVVEAPGTHFFAEVGDDGHIVGCATLCTEAIEVSAGGPVCGLNIPAGQWHTVRALESGSVILEMKEGAYEALGEEDVLKL